MKEETRKVLRENNTILLKDLDPDDVMPFMVQEGVFDTNMQDCIKCAGPRRRQAEEFLHTLERQGEAAFYIFLQALQGSSPHLCNILREKHDGKDIIDNKADLTKKCFIH
jgi:hypothetical protein